MNLDSSSKEELQELLAHCIVDIKFTSSMIEDIISNPILDYEETEAVAHSLIKE